MTMYNHDSPDIPTMFIIRCFRCDRPCCQCEICAKVKAHSGLCAKCYRADEAAKPTEAKT